MGKNLDGRPFVEPNPILDKKQSLILGKSWPRASSQFWLSEEHPALDGGRISSLNGGQTRLGTCSYGFWMLGILLKQPINANPAAFA